MCWGTKRIIRVTRDAPPAVGTSYNDYNYVPTQERGNGEFFILF